MAISPLYSANVTKYDAGGSGDNYIKDGLIKTVEKVWTDSYTLAAVTTTLSAISLGKVPKGKKITDVIVYLPAWGTATTATIGLSLTTGRPANTETTGNLGLVHGVNGEGDGSFDPTLLNATAAQKVHLNPAYVLTTTSTTNEDIWLMFTAATTLTAGTIRSIIKYV